MDSINASLPFSHHVYSQKTSQQGRDNQGLLSRCSWNLATKSIPQDPETSTLSTINYAKLKHMKLATRLYPKQIYVKLVISLKLGYFFLQSTPSCSTELFETVIPLLLPLFGATIIIESLHVSSQYGAIDAQSRCLASSHFTCVNRSAFKNK